MFLGLYTIFCVLDTLQTYKEINFGVLELW